MSGVRFVDDANNAMRQSLVREKKKPKLLRCWSIEELEWGVTLSYENNFSLIHFWRLHTSFAKGEIFSPHSPYSSSCCCWTRSNLSMFSLMLSVSSFLRSSTLLSSLVVSSTTRSTSFSEHRSAAVSSSLGTSLGGKFSFFIHVIFSFFKDLVAQWYLNLTFTISDISVDIEELFLADIAIWDNFSWVYVLRRIPGTRR